MNEVFATLGTLSLGEQKKYTFFSACRSIALPSAHVITSAPRAKNKTCQYCMNVGLTRGGVQKG